LSYSGAEELGHGRSLAPATTSTGGNSSDERISGAFYVGRASFRMETIEGGAVSAPILGAATPARGVGYLPIDADEEIPSSEDLSASTIKDGSDDRSWDEQPTTVFVEPFSTRAPLLMSRSLAVMVGLLAFLSGAVVSAIGLTTLKHPPDLIARAAALIRLERVEKKEPPVAPTLPSPQVIAPDLPEAAPPADAELLLSMPEDSEPERAEPPAMTTFVAAPEAPPAITPRIRHKRPSRSPRASSPTPPAAEVRWVDPFAD